MFSDKIKGKLGFGCMRLPMIDDEINKEEFCRMIDAYMDAGFHYFDTAHGYINGKSEHATRECLTARYDREDYVLADKLSYWCFQKEEDVVPFFEKQLDICGVEYFDFYLFHCLNHEGYAKHKACNTFEIIKKLKDQGKIKHYPNSEKALVSRPALRSCKRSYKLLRYFALSPYARINYVSPRFRRLHRADLARFDIHLPRKALASPVCRNDLRYRSNSFP